ncbi:MAG: efflux RND transporter periplasmic adaptor subunit [Gemmatimonadetes bacterium]|nr:efflux RND transporter periplasmic adaptor subunit [Gemmatimonadota bacterium]
MGQVTVDETRVQTIAPRIDGWVEHLYVNFTGRRVISGASHHARVLAHARDGPRRVAAGAAPRG